MKLKKPKKQVVVWCLMYDNNYVIDTYKTREEARKAKRTQHYGAAVIGLRADQ